MAAPIALDRIDHFVLTVADLEATVVFYISVLGMDVVREPDRPTALHFGQHKINVHQRGQEFSPRAQHPTPGSGDFCLIVRGSIDDVMAHLEACGVAVELGPVERTGALGPMISIYFRDPDDNLVELAAYE